MTQTVVLKVAMSCGGCSGAVKRVLTKMEGVDSFDIDMEQQKVTVIGNVEPELVLQTVAKTGKKSAFWPAEEAPAPAPVTEPVQAPPPAEPVEASPTTEPEAKPAEPVAVA